MEEDGVAAGTGGGVSGGAASGGLGFPTLPNFPPGFSEELGPGGKENPQTEEPTLGMLVAEMRSMSLAQAQNFKSLSGQLALQAAQFKSDLDALRAEMVTRTMHEELETRVSTLRKEVDKLSNGGATNAEMNRLRQQVNRLDPANRSLCFLGFKTTDLEKRVQCAKDFLKKIGLEDSIRAFEHVSTGPPDKRVPSSVMIVELASRSVRELALKSQEEADSILNAGDLGTLKVGRAKTSVQMQRNSFLRKALEIIKKDVRFKGKSPEIHWKIDGSRDRTIMSGGQVVFTQTPIEMEGSFSAPFADLSL